MQSKNIQSPKFPNIHYRIMGQGNALVLLHGFPETGDLWSEVWGELSKEFTLIIPDLPGSGKSMRCAEPLTMDLIAECVKQILDEEGIEQIVLAGHSMGGYAALAFAELYQGYLKGLIMVHSMANDDTDEKKEQRRKSIVLIEKGGKDVFVRQMIPNLFSETYKKNNETKILAHIEAALKQDAESLSDFYNAMIKRPNRVQLLSGLPFPILWLIGKEDTIASPDKVLQQSTHANVNFVEVYANCAHMGMQEQPSMLVNDIVMFTKYCSRLI
jgi:hypothetical protein